MKTTLYYLSIAITLVVLLLSCNKNKRVTDNNYENVEIDINKTIKTPGTVFSKIEIIPLQTNDTVLLNRIKSVNYFNNKYYVVIDKNLIVHVFDSNGQFISNSSGKTGRGPEEYYTINDAIYNQFTDRIDLLGYDNSEIITYDKKFNFVTRVKIKTKEKFHFSSFIALSKDTYALTPNLLECTDKVIIYNIKNNQYETLLIEGNISKLTMTESPFKYCHNSKTVYFTPLSINYSVFEIKPSNQRLDKTINLDILSHPIEDTKLQSLKTEREKVDFLLNESSSVLPLRNMVSSKYVTSIIIRDKDLYTFIHNRTTNTNNTIKNKYSSNHQLPLFFTLEDNILFSLVNSFDINMYIAENLADENEKLSLSKINNDSNPIIVKYYLK